MDPDREMRARVRRTVRPGAVIAALAAAVAASAPGAFAAPKAAHVVAIDGTRYVPAEVTVKKGETVRWTNKDPFPHTVTAHGAFDSKEIGAGGSWSWVARKPGRYDYICTLHPNMKGTVVVQ